VTPNSNFKDLLRALKKCGVSYLVVGGYAVMLYSEPRFTKALDVSIDRSSENSGRVFRALAEFGAPLAGISAGDFAKADVIYQLGVPPSRMDILTSITAVEFAEAWPRRTSGQFDDVTATFTNRQDLLANKRATGRASDQVNCERLQESRERAE
jgi:hypothetical protein